MKVAISLKGNKVVIKKSDNIVDALKSENSDLRNIVHNQAAQTSEMDRYYNNVIARGMNADSPAYKALDRRK